MLKKFFTGLSLALLSLIVVGCGSRHGKTKVLSVPVGHVVADSVVSFRRDAQCRIHIDFAYLKGQKYAAVNDSLLRMGTLQPNYLAISYERLVPQSAVRTIMERYAREYSELAQWLHDREKARSQLDWELNIKTRIIPGRGKRLVYLSDIYIKTGDAASRYQLAHNFDPETGRQTRLSDEFGADYKERLTKDIVEQMADQLGLDDDNLASLQRAGYFAMIDPYPAENFILYDDSVTFIYTAGEINPKEVRVTLEK
ncbi:DUF3298 domain-containing protein [Prevotella corporis]|uniref:RsiV family protein n=1 Tax=Prevotella corporis TaxID=28128 RepID=UPI0027E3F392|nr:RsiV family protein [Prevotella corporis]MDQ7736419.1 DUF3298 domain-containing protein [Prevotella corporis]